MKPELQETGEERHVPHVREVEDVAGFEAAPAAQGHVHRARWQIFAPTLAIGALYAGLWAWLYANGLGGGSIARLVLLVIAVGVPLLAAHAFLRFETIRVQVLDGGVRYHPGWPKDMPVDMPFELIERIEVKRGLSGRMLGGGTLVMQLTTGERVAIADLAHPAAAQQDIAVRLRP